jgi:hypothetical protein
VRTIAVACLWALVASTAAADPPRAAAWSTAFPALEARVRASRRLVVHIVVALCHRDQVACGAHGLGNPGSLRTNLYWGARFGVRRFFEREGGWELAGVTERPPGALERRAYRRRVPGAAWGVEGTVEVLAVADAVHGAHIDRAVDGFYDAAAQGERLGVELDGAQHTLAADVVGYVGHNRLMDGKRLAPRGPSARAAPSFVLACMSEKYFAAPLRAAGSEPLVTTGGFMAPEGYVVEAVARALGDNLPRADVRGRAVAAYAAWQRLSPGRASQLFAPGPRGR